ncbi:unnamed protein product [Amoebophrya sp. A120]|nr:unnamed protein product [Amoebophrya sp. A120]|eukprot:GSA120T00001271001.1
MAELRAMMQAAKERRTQTKAPPKFAKWLSNGELQCLICGAHVRSEALWPAHLQTATHQKALLEWKKKAMLKNAQSSGATAAAAQQKLPAAAATSSPGASEDKEAGAVDEAATTGKPKRPSPSGRGETAAATKQDAAGSVKDKAPVKPKQASAGAGGYSSSEEEDAEQKPTTNANAVSTDNKQQPPQKEVLHQDDELGITISVAKITPAGAQPPEPQPPQIPTKAEEIKQRVVERLQNKRPEDGDHALGGDAGSSYQDPALLKRRKVVGPMLIDNFDVDDITMEELELYPELAGFAAGTTLTSVDGGPGDGGGVQPGTSAGTTGSSNSSSSTTAAGVIKQPALVRTVVEETPVNTNVPAGFFDDAEEEAEAKGVTKPSKLREMEFENDLKRLDIEADRDHREGQEKRNQMADERHRRQQEEEKDRREEMKGQLQRMRQALNERQKKREEEKDLKESSDDESSSEEYHGVDWRCG